MSVNQNNAAWNRVNPPLNRIDNPKSHKTVIGLIELLKKMDALLTST